LFDRQQSQWLSFQPTLQCQHGKSVRVGRNLVPPVLWEFGEPPFFWAVFVLFNGYYNWIYGVSDKMAGVQYSRLASKLLI
jgi:hypothetical protein